MGTCPFHDNSQTQIANGDIHNVDCPSCGTYRISDVALSDLRHLRTAPTGWRELVRRSIARHTLISTRDTRALTT
ncbi:MAG: hypothetical protein GXP16_00965 [Gammaproteobacteria bacterium]|nr:hypothetical protein [Gammaproteobacteria bacterium]